jgi:DNA-binding response OmpR family regulator
MSTVAKRIVLVDDDDDFAEAVKTFLEMHGYEVHRASDGTSGVTLAQRVHADLVLMDIIMKDRTDGFFAVHNLRHTPGMEKVPVFVVSSVYTSAPDFQVIPERSWLGTDRFFPKPMDLQALLKAIAATIGGDGVGALPPNTGTTIK